MRDSLSGGPITPESQGAGDCPPHVLEVTGGAGGVTGRDGGVIQVTFEGHLTPSHG